MQYSSFDQTPFRKNKTPKEFSETAFGKIERAIRFVALKTGGCKGSFHYKEIR